MLKYAYLFFLLPMFTLAQEQSFQKPKQDLFFEMDGFLGVDLASIIKPSRDDDNQDVKTYFTYGGSARIGYHFIPHLSFSTGVKYAYVTPNYHPIYWTFQTTYHFNLTNENTTFLSLYYGDKINRTTIEDSKLFGLKVGMLTPTESFLNLSASAFLEYQSLGGVNTGFVGLNVGFSIFTGTNNL